MTAGARRARVKPAAKSALKAAAFLAVFFAAAYMTDCDPALFWARKSHLADIFIAMLPPDWAYAAKVVGPLWATVQMSVTGTVLGAAAALPAAMLCAANLPAPAPLRNICRVVIQLLRSFPALILALLATFLFGLGTFAGTAALTVYTFAIMARLTYEDIETAPLAAYRALVAMGTPPSRAFCHAVLPAIAPAYLANVLYMLETNVRNSAILGYVGAGGIGLLLNEKISWLEYDRVAVILLLLYLTVCLLEWVSRFLGSVVREERPLTRRAKRALAAALAAAFILCTATLAGPDLEHTSGTLIRNMLYGLCHPDWSFFFDTSSTGLFRLLLETVCIALVGTGIGALIALPLSILNTPRLVPGPLAAVFQLFVMAVRTIPFFLYGLIFIRVTGPGAFAGVLTLAVCSVGLLTKRFTEAIEALDFRAYDALAAMGTPFLRRVRFALWPQAAPALRSAVLYRFDVNIREASVLGIVGAGGIGAPLVFAMNRYAWPTAGAICLGLVILVWIVDLLSARARRHWQ